jgi:two-component system chemotaxis response regulator CheY
MSKTVLAVDDSKTMRDMVSFALTEAGFAVTTADDWAHGLEVEQGGQYDVIITDINRHNMDGITLIGHLRGLSQYQSTPILILTTESEQGKRDQGKNAGATGWIVKPFNPEKLIQVVNKVAA